MRRLAHDLHGDVAAHGEPREGKSGRCVVEKPSGDAGNRIIPGMVRHDDGALPRESRDLRLEKPGGTGQTGNQNESFGHSNFPLSPLGKFPWIDKRIACPMVRPLLNLSKSLR